MKKSCVRRLIPITVAIGLLGGLLSVALMNRGGTLDIVQSPAAEPVASHAAAPSVHIPSLETVAAPEAAMAPSSPVTRASAVNAEINRAAPVAEYASNVVAPADALGDISTPVDALAAVATPVDALPVGVSMPERIPPVEECLPLVVPDIRRSYEVFVRRYPGVDPTEAEEFQAAMLDERFSYGFEVPEESWQEYTDWVREMEHMQQQLVNVRGDLAGLPLYGTDEAGRGYLLSGFEGAQPIYQFTTNVEAAITTAASYVRYSGDFLNVHGGPLRVNIHDGGTAYEHPEFILNGNSRIILREGANADNWHATMVTGVLGAAGLDPLAMGMAPRVRIRSFQGGGGSQALDYGMVINGDTGKSIVGNESMTQSTIYPGMYQAHVAAYDQVSWDVPYYLFFVGSANDGNKGDYGGFNTLGGLRQACKNVVTVGNVHEVTRGANGAMTGGGAIRDSSSRGPARDGRIKPDIVANGVQVYTTNETGGYSTASGTSLSSPNAAGSAVLLVDYWRKRFNESYPRAATIKALIIHSADDLGNPGPDYTYGWGVMNTLRAARQIRRQADNPSRNNIVEGRKTSQTISMPYTRVGSNPITVTLAWADPPGPVQTDYNDRSPRLVNNLHLRVIAPGNVSHYPYVMPYVTGQGGTPAFHTSLYNATAVRGVNNTDNVNRIDIANPVDGNYTIEITHTGSLTGGGQDFSLVVQGLQQ